MDCPAILDACFSVNRMFTSTTEGEGGYVFIPLCLFVTCKIEDFSTIWLVDFVILNVCLSFITYSNIINKHRVLQGNP